MARRSASSSSLRSQAARKAASAIEVHCPDCGASYQLPEEKLDRKVQCRQCQRIFVPANILRKSRRRSRGLGFRPSAALGLILAIGLIVVGAVVLHDKLGQKTPDQAPQAAGPAGPTPEEVALRVAPIEALESWITAINGADMIRFDLLTDQGAFFDRLPAEERPKDERDRPLTYRLLDPVQKIEWKSRLFQRLTQDDLGQPIRGRQLLPPQTEILQGNPLVDGLVRIKAAFREGERVGNEYILSFDLAHEGRSTPPRWVVQGLSVLETPRLAGEGTPIVGGKPRPTVPPENVPEGIQEVESTVAEDGKTVIHEHPIVPLGHLKETPEPLREEIDRLIELFASEDVRPRDRNTAVDRLREIGRPAFPRLLNLIHDVHTGPEPDSHHNIATLAALINLIIGPMTDCYYGYDPGPEQEPAKRVSTLKRYFGWWARHSSPRYWETLRQRREARSPDKL